MRSTLLLAALLLLPVRAGADELSVRTYAGASLGAPFPLTVQGTSVLERSGRRLASFDLGWAPSRYWQSYELGAAWHPFGNAWLAGARLRYLQLHPPWSRGFDPDFDHQFAVGGELGARFLVAGRWLGTASVGGFGVPFGDADLPVFFTLNVGVGYEVWQRSF